MIKSIKSKDLPNKEIILEVGSKNNAKKIFGYSKKEGYNLFSQKIAWKKVKNLTDIPISYKDGSLIISLEDKLR